MRSRSLSRAKKDLHRASLEICLNLQWLLKAAEKKEIIIIEGAFSWMCLFDSSAPLPYFRNPSYLRPLFMYLLCSTTKRIYQMTEVVQEWSEMPLDTRILEALGDLKWERPTTIQAACIPLALKGKDLSIQSNTGSGKSGAFVIPLIQRIISDRQQHGGAKKASKSNPIALLLVVSAELSTQTAEVVESLVKYIKPRITVDNIAAGGAVTATRLASSNIIVAPAALLAKYCAKGTLTAATFEHLKYLVVDEADMVVSVAEKSLRSIQSMLPSVLQVVLASATLTEELLTMKGKLLHKPTNVILTDDKRPSSSDGNQVAVESRVALRSVANTLHQHYLVASDECHRHTLLFGLFRLRLIEGKTLIFVDTDDETYRLQHFLEQLGIATLLYDPGLPMNVRLNTLKRFQAGEVKVMVCTDGTLESVEKLNAAISGSDDTSADIAPRKKKRSERNRSNEDAPSALHRGVDFHKVRNVILFDGVDSTSSISLSRYTHRIGRVARAGEEGFSIVFFTVPQAKKYIAPLRAYCESNGNTLTPYKKMERSEAAKLQYRVDSVLENVTRAATRKLKVATVAAELSRSSYLSHHLSEKDNDALKKVLERSKKSIKIERNLLHIPEYLRIEGAEDADHFTKRVRADKTRATAFKQLTKKAPADPVKMAMSKIRATRKK
eukprot:gene4347-3161_t